PNTPTATSTPQCSEQNLCGFIRSPGFWSSYQNHMSDAQFSAILENTQDYSGLSIAQALAILTDTSDQYHRHLLSAELNAAWNGDLGDPLPGNTLGIGIYVNPAYPSSSLNGLTVNQIDHIAYLTSPDAAGDDLQAFVLYVGGDGESASPTTCLVTAPQCR